MSKPVDVFITEAELEEGRKAKKTACLKIDRATLAPVHCVSKPGVSTGTLFTISEPRRVGRYLTDKEMSVMYDKFVGPGSLNNAAVRHEVTERERSANISPCHSSAGTESRAPSIDSGNRHPAPPSATLALVMAAAGCPVKASEVEERLQERAASAATMKYVAPRIAKKYGIQQSITPASARAAAAAARNSAGRGGRPPPGSLAAVADRLQSGASASSDVPAVVFGSGRPPRPPSAVFNATSRDKAQRTGTRFVYGGPVDVPAPGKYTPKYGAMDKAQHAPVWSKTAGAPQQEGAGGSNAPQHRWRPGSAPGASGPGGSASRPASAPAQRATDDDPSSAAAHDPQAQPPGGQGQQAPGGATGPRRTLSRSQSSQGPAHHKHMTQEALSQLQQRHDDLFVGAHRVHQKRPEWPPGSQPFRAAERKPMYEEPMANHLFGEYYHQGYDSLTRKASRPTSAFRGQTQRQWDKTLGETGPGVGPGSYNRRAHPGTHTGRHVPAGHPSLTQTPDWSRTTPRPCSAPPVRPVSAAAVHQGYWGPEGPATALFPDEPDYNELVAVRFLQERTTIREPGLPPRRAPSQQLQLQQQQAVAAAAAAAAGPPAASGAPPPPPPPGLAPESGVEQRPLVYVGPERFGTLSSTGLAKRVPGGSFSMVTREGSCQAMRAMSNNKITPPAAVAVKAAQDLAYEYDYSLEAHHGRTPGWTLPPNRNALSQQWVAAAATAYLS